MKGKTMQNIADLLGINQATLYRKINGSSDFYRREIQAICNYLEIVDPNEFFFCSRNYVNAKILSSICTAT